MKTPNMILSRWLMCLLISMASYFPLHAQLLDLDDSPNPFANADTLEAEEPEPFFPEPLEHTFFFDYLSNDRFIYQHFVKDERDRNIIDESYHRSVTGVQLSSDVEEMFFTVAGPQLKEFYQLYEPYNRGSIISQGLQHALQIGQKPMDIYFVLVDDREGLEEDTASFFHLVPHTRHRDRQSVFPRVDVWHLAAPENNKAWVYLGEEELQRFKYYYERYEDEKDKGFDAMQDLITLLLVKAQFVGYDTISDIAGQGLAIYAERDEDRNWLEQAWEDPGQALVEGLAYFYALLGQADEQEKLLATISDKQSEVIVYSTALIRQMEERKKEKLPLSPYSDDYRQFPREDVHLHFLLNFESTATAFYLLFRDAMIHEKGMDEIGLKLIDKAAHRMTRLPEYRYLPYQAMELSDYIREYIETPEGKAHHAADPAVNPLLPFAILDMLTVYSLEEAHFEKESSGIPFRITGPPAALKTYWEEYRFDLMKYVGKKAYPVLEKPNQLLDRRKGFEAIIEYFRKNISLEPQRHGEGTENPEK